MEYSKIARDLKGRGLRWRVVFHHADGTRDEVQARHTLNADQIGWFKAGSALNVLRKKR